MKRFSEIFVGLLLVDVLLLVVVGTLALIGRML